MSPGGGHTLAWLNGEYEEEKPKEIKECRHSSWEEIVFLTISIEVHLAIRKLLVFVTIIKYERLSILERNKVYFAVVWRLKVHNSCSHICIASGEDL